MTARLEHITTDLIILRKGHDSPVQIWCDWLDSVDQAQGALRAYRWHQDLIVEVMPEGQPAAPPVSIRRFPDLDSATWAGLEKDGGELVLSNTEGIVSERPFKMGPPPSFSGTPHPHPEA